MDARRDQFEAQAKIFKARGHPARLMMADALRKGPLCVSDLHKIAGGNLSTVSQHLEVLRNAGVVRTEKIGNKVICRLAIPCLDQFLACTCRTVARDACSCGCRAKACEEK